MQETSMKKHTETGLILAGLTLLPAASAFAAGLVIKGPPPMPLSECSLPRALSFFCFLGF
jgi:hypothetical protein